MVTSQMCSSRPHSQTLSTIIPSYGQFYVDLLRKCLESSNLLRGRAIHAKLFKILLPSVYLHNHLLNFYAKCGRLNYALKLFDQMCERNVVSWSAIISGFVQHGCSHQALSLFSRMQHDSMVAPNEFTVVSALHACSLSENPIHLYQMYGLIVRLGFESNVFVVNAFVTALIRHGKLLEAKEVFEGCPNKDTVSWNAMMSGFLKHSYFQLPSFWYQMISEGFKPDHFTFATVFTGLASIFDLSMGLQVHGQLVKSGHGADICVGNSLCDMYMKNWRVSDGSKAFHEMTCADVRSYTQMAANYLHCGNPGKALELLTEMLKMGLMPNKFTLATAFNACADLPSLEDGKRFHGLRIKLGSQVDICVDNALLDMYAKSGCMDESWVVFNSMPNRSVVSWTAMIMGCAQNGQAREALEFFDDMRMEGVEPNHITFICVLYACSQGGFIDEGRKYFSSMAKDHRISPGEDHYACMVNLLGRAGHIREAEELILRMPFKPGVLVWQTLLGACELHGEMEIGKRAAKRAIDLDGIDPSSYVLLSNMFAGLKNWESVRMLRKLMENRDVKKVPGSSWIEVENVCSVNPA
ncbi:pentatricopeptide repeat-containing protein At4g33170 [Manihot esculenta]|nr:pentatricopeptide repeat-containing protein At4g33170 [Manihot esculenta]